MKYFVFILAVPLLTLIGCSHHKAGVVDAGPGAADLGGGDFAVAEDLSAVDLGDVDLSGVDLTGVPSTDHLVFVVQPSLSVLLGALIGLPIQVRLLDGTGAIRTDANDAVSLTLAGLGDAHLFGVTTVNAKNGVATFSDVRADDTGTGFTLVAAATGYDSATSHPFDVVDPTWQNAVHGPFGGRVFWVGLDEHSPSVAYAQTGSGLFRTADATTANCCTWKNVSPRVASSPVISSPSQDLALTVGLDGKVALSTDKGLSFSVLTTAPMTASSAAIDRAASANLWIGTTGGTVSQSTNTGAAWSDWSTGLPTSGNAIDSLIVVSGTPSVVFAGVHGLAVSRRATTDAAWTQVGAPLPVNSTDYHGLVADRADNASAYLVIDNLLYHYHLGDATWIARSTPSGANVTALATTTDAMISSALASAKVYATTNAGGAWNLLATPPLTFDAIADEAATHTLAASHGDGVWDLDTVGTNAWAKKSNGLNGFTGQFLNIHSTTEGTVYAIGANEGEGFYKTTDAGANWTSLSSEQVDDFAFDPVDAQTIYATLGGVGKSIDGGATWMTLFVESTITSLAIDPTNPMIIYAGNLSGVIYKTIDGGQNWTPISGTGLPALWVRQLLIDPATPTTIYALSANSTYKSIDSGETWAAKHDGQSNAVRLLMDPQTPTTLYAMGDFDIVKTIDGGESTWTNASTGIGGTKQLYGVAIDTFHPNKVYVLATNGIFRSIDSGTSWEAIFGPSIGYTPRALAIDPQNPGVIYLSTANVGILRTQVQP